MTRRVLAPKRPNWFRAATAIGVSSLAVYVALAWSAPWSPGRFWGLTFGTIATIIFLVDALYPLRRRLVVWPLDTAQRWLQFHIYGGALACLCVLIHVGFRLPGGQFGWWLVGLTIGTMFSGAVGVWLQKWIPTVLSSNLSVEAIAERVPELVGQLQADGDEIAGGASETLERFYAGQVRPLLAGIEPSWSYLIDIRAGRERSLAPFKEVAPFVGEAEQSRLSDLQALVTEKLELEAHYSLQRILRVWLLIHVPPSMVLMGLVLVHVVSVWFF